jgi:hypothetical protein
LGKSKKIKSKYKSKREKIKGKRKKQIAKSISALLSFGEGLGVRKK